MFLLTGIVSANEGNTASGNSTKGIIIANIDEEKQLEKEGFEYQTEDIAYESGEIAANNISLGQKSGLTYYSQVDNRWRNHLYTSVGRSSQTIGSSGCGPTSAAMVVSSIRGVIEPHQMGDLFVQNGYRSANNGTYLAAFQWTADKFDIPFQSTTNLDRAVELARNNNYVIVSVNSGLFTYGGHLLVIVGVDGNNLKIYDPYLYAGKFDVSTRRGKASVSGNTVTCSIDNFRRYANAGYFFAYENTEGGSGAGAGTGSTANNNNADTKYVSTSSGIGVNVRSGPGTNYGRVTGYADGTAVSVYEQQGNWSRVGTNQWIHSDYIAGSPGASSNNSSTSSSTNTTSSTYTTGNYRVTASVLNVRTGPSTNYRAKTYSQLTSNARQQNQTLGNRYTNGYKNGVVCTVTRISGNWGLTASGWISLEYCNKI